MQQQSKTTANPNATTVRHTRVPDELWDAACAKAAGEGAGASEMIRSLLRAYVAGRVNL